jgi:modulator of FtsH protease
MLNLFPPVLERWHDVFLLTGTAAVTLVGLLFVSLSFNLDVLLHDSRAHLLALARQAFTGFLLTLVISLECLQPDWHQRPFGAGLITLGAFVLVFSVRPLLHLGKSGDFSRLQVLRRTMGGIVAGVAMVWSGIMLLSGDVQGLQGVMLALIFLLASGTTSAWDLLVKVGRVKLELEGKS